MKNKIRLTESQLINMIKKTVKTVLKEQSNVPNKQFPILNNTNQTATGEEKMMIDEFNKFLLFLTNKKIDYDEKEMKKQSFIDKFFSNSKKIGIADEMLKSSGYGDLFGNAEDWYDTVCLFGLDANLKYKTGVKYFSLDENGKIFNLVLG